MSGTRNILDAKVGVIALGAAIAALGIAIYYALMMDVRLANDRIGEAVHIEADFQREIGYGGLIHNYKNYVLRGAETFRLAAIDNHREAIATLARLSALSPGMDGSEFDAVRRTLDAYRANLDVIADAHANGIDVREIERLTSVDGRRAIIVLAARVHALHEALEERRDQLLETKWRIFIGIGTCLASLAVISLVLIRRVSRRILSQAPLGSDGPAAAFGAPAGKDVRRIMARHW